VSRLDAPTHGARRPLTDAGGAGGVNTSLRHVMVVAGTLAEWSGLSAERWDDRVEGLGGVCASIGVPWLTIRAYERGAEPTSVDDLVQWRRQVGSCEVIVDPCGDGRERFADAMGRLAPEDEVNEATVSAALYEPADSEPDLVMILGPSTRLPPSLVWELAYAELVYVDASWDDLAVDHLSAAISDFSHRRRRFGGLDDAFDDSDV